MLPSLRHACMHHFGEKRHKGFEPLSPVLLGYVFANCFTRFQNMNLDTSLLAMDATGAIAPANLTSPRPVCNGRRPGPGFGQKSWKLFKFDFADPSDRGYISRA